MTDSPARDRVRVIVGDITGQPVDAIVNAANTRLKAGGGVDGAVHRAAGPDLQRYLDRHFDGCPTGECRESPGFNLPAPAILHCVGPVWTGGASGEDDLLAACYRNALRQAARSGHATIAFPAISTGVFGYPPERAARVAVGTVLSALERDQEAVFVCFDGAMKTHFDRALATATDTESLQTT